MHRAHKIVNRTCSTVLVVPFTQGSTVNSIIQHNLLQNVHLFQNTGVLIEFNAAILKNYLNNRQLRMLVFIFIRVDLTHLFLGRIKETIGCMQKKLLRPL